MTTSVVQAATAVPRDVTADQTLESTSGSDKLEQTSTCRGSSSLEQQEMAEAGLHLRRSATDDEKVSAAVEQLRSSNEISVHTASDRAATAATTADDDIDEDGSRIASPQAPLQAKRRSVIRSTTLAADNKKRPLVLAQTAIRFAAEPELDVADSQSIAKSEALKRIQANLVEWDELLGQIESGKARSDQLMRYEVEKREKTISALKSDIDCLKIDMTKLNEAKKTVTSRLDATSSSLVEKEAQNEELDQRLHAYETAYDEMTNAKEQLESELSELSRVLTEKDNINRRLNEQNTELQAQLEIEMQRSKTCAIL